MLRVLMTCFAWLGLMLNTTTVAQQNYEHYAPTVNAILEAGKEKNEAHRKLVELCDDIGHRVSGSESLNQAVEWAIKTMKREGHENVRSEKVMVNHWIRGQESCDLIEPKAKSLAMLGLGGSVGTPPEGITAEVIVVSNKEQFDQLSTEAVQGKIVLFNGVMPPYSETKGSGYGTAVQYRSSGAKWASEKGAVATLVRSITAYSLYSPHTGAMRYGDAKTRIPAAAITIEDAEYLARNQERGIKSVVRLSMGAQDGGEVPSSNVLAEIVGREHPEEIVVIGGHLDSWDVGQGAQDDGAGCVAAMEALSILRRLGLKPRRTIRVVLWTDEEKGGAGAAHYAAHHQHERHVAGIESDSGGFTPRGLSLEMQDRAAESRALEQLKQMMQLLAPLGRLEAKAGGSGADVGKLKPLGTACMGLDVDGRLYFNTHHTHADTVDKVDPQQLGDCATLLAAAAYLLAEIPERIGQ